MNRWKDSRIKRTKRPSFKMCFGRTWDGIDVILPDGKQIEGKVDSTWGRWVYFIDSGTCYKVSMDYNSNWKIDLTKDD